MNVKINYAMIYTEQIRDLILDKLTVLFNKAMLKSKVRLLLRVPDMFDLQRAQKYREIFDEVAISRFTIEDPSFWNMRNLYNFEDYCMSRDISEKYVNVFIEQSRLLTGWPSEKSDIIVANEYAHETLMTQYLSIVELLREHGYNIETKEEFTCWDLSACSFSNSVKKSLYFKLEEVIQSISHAKRYISDVETHILISALLDQVQEEIDDISILNLEIEKTVLDKSMVEHMYTLI